MRKQRTVKKETATNNSNSLEQINNNNKSPFLPTENYSHQTSLPLSSPSSKRTKIEQTQQLKQERLLHQHEEEDLHETINYFIKVGEAQNDDIIDPLESIVKYQNLDIDMKHGIFTINQDIDKHEYNNDNGNSSDNTASTSSLVKSIYFWPKELSNRVLDMIQPNILHDKWCSSRDDDDDNNNNDTNSNKTELIQMKRRLDEGTQWERIYNSYTIPLIRSSIFNDVFIYDDNTNNGQQQQNIHSSTASNTIISHKKQPLILDDDGNEAESITNLNDNIDSILLSLLNTCWNRAMHIASSTIPYSSSSSTTSYNTDTATNTIKQQESPPTFSAEEALDQCLRYNITFSAPKYDLSTSSYKCDICTTPSSSSSSKTLLFPTITSLHKHIFQPQGCYLQPLKNKQQIFISSILLHEINRNLHLLLQKTMFRTNTSSTNIITTIQKQPPSYNRISTKKDWRSIINMLLQNHSLSSCNTTNSDMDNVPLLNQQVINRIVTRLVLRYIRKTAFHEDEDDTSSSSSSSSSTTGDNSTEGSISSTSSNSDSDMILSMNSKDDVNNNEESHEETNIFNTPIKQEYYDDDDDDHPMDQDLKDKNHTFV